MKTNQLISITIPPTPHTQWLNGEYREKLLLLLELHGFKGLSKMHFTSLEALAYNHELICLVWDRECNPRYQIPPAK
jgi:hypothetical protein